MDTRRKFSREFKLEAVKMVKDRGGALKQVARDLGECKTAQKWPWTGFTPKQRLAMAA